MELILLLQSPIRLKRSGTLTNLRALVTLDPAKDLCMKSTVCRQSIESWLGKRGVSETALFPRAVFLGKRGVSETALFSRVDFFCLCRKSTEKLPLSLRKKGRFRNGPFFKGSFLGKKGRFRNGLFFKGRFFCHCRNLVGSGT
jgi:hypothetical protein